MRILGAGMTAEALARDTEESDREYITQRQQGEKKNAQVSEPHSVSAPTSPRALSDIAWEIRRTWKRVYFGAVPYLDAMFTMHRVTDNYGCDSGESVVLYFLSNATTWRGADARRIKAELKALLKGAR